MARIPRPRFPRLRFRLWISTALVAAATVPVVTAPASGAPDGERQAAATGVGGYWLYASDGGIFSFGTAAYQGPARNQSNDIIGMAATPSGNGYWMADDDGDVFPVGDAKAFGSRASTTNDVAAFAARPQGDGYWLATRSGAIESFGAAPKFPRVTVTAARRITAMAPTASGAGAWMAGVDGGVFSFGDAKFFGSMGGTRLNQPVVGMAPTPTGRGYWLVAADGGIFSFGDAKFFGSMGGTRLNQPVVGMAATPSGAGYWLVAADGGMFAFGDARFFGSMGGKPLSAPVRGMITRPGSPELILLPGHDAPPGAPGVPAPGVPGVPNPPAPPGSPVATLVGAGDIAQCSSSKPAAQSKAEQTARLLDKVVRDDPSAVVFTTGDNAYNDGKLSEFNNCYDPTWGRHKNRTRPVPGNHDYHTSNASGYYTYFGSKAGEQGKGYYSYDLGAWHVVVLNSNCDAVGGCKADSPQGKWLAADLAKSKAVCTVAMWHHPRFNSGRTHGNNMSVDPLWKILYQAGADLVINGHVHVYERFAPQTPDAKLDTAHGIRQITVGTGGAPGYAFETTPQPNSEVRHTGTDGVLKLTLRATGYDFEFIPVAGKTFTDQGSGTCHGRP